MPPVLRVRLTGSYNRVAVVGEDQREHPVVEGPHEAVREGDTLVVRGDAGSKRTVASATAWNATVSGFSGSGGSRLSGQVVLNVGGGDTEAVTVRLPAGVVLEGRLDAAALTIEHVDGPVDVRLGAGSVEAEGCGGPVGIGLQTGRILVEGRAAAHPWTLDCQAGTLQVVLSADSSARVEATLETGTLSVPGGDRPPAIGPARQVVTLGQGAAAVLAQVGAGTLTVRKAG